MRTIPIYAAAILALCARPARASNPGSSQSLFLADKKCSIYLAPSSVHGNPGFGIYTTRDIAIGEPILSGPPGTPDGPTLPIVDSPVLLQGSSSVFDKDHARNVKLQKASKHWNHLFGHYWWGRGVPDHTAYEADIIYDFQITFGALPNHNCMLASLDSTLPDNAYEDSLTDRFQDPGAGAYSYHRGRIFHNAAYYERNLTAGSEIFLDYGLCDRDASDGLWYPEWTKHIPMTQDFEMATTALLSQYNLLAETYEDDIPLDLPLDYGQGAATQQQTENSETKASTTLSPQARAIMPKTSGELIDALEFAFSTDKKRTGVHKLDKDALQRYLALEFGTNQREPQWIEDNGMCIENLIPLKSTLPHAGQGAFTQHFIGEGEVVVPVPLLHIVDKAVLNMETRIKFKESKKEQEVKASGQQLLLNYCFSHNKSTLALCPTSNAILINHCSTRLKGANSCGPKGPNARYRWAGENWDPRTKIWLTKTVDEMGEHLDRLLAMEIVATRDIQIGEEVFIDYGVEWEQAWLKHIEEWESPLFGSEISYSFDFEHKWLYYLEGSVVSNETAREHGHFSITEANRNNSGPLPYLVSGDLGREENHPNIFTGCLYWATSHDQDDVFWKPSDYVEYHKMGPEDILNRYAYDGRMFHKQSKEATAADVYWPCQVLYQDNEDDSDEITYTVRISEYPRSPGELPWMNSETPRILYYYPRSSIRYFSKPYRGDVFLPSAFRHYIPIDDEIFPAQWRNVEDDGSQQSNAQCTAESESCANR